MLLLIIEEMLQISQTLYVSRIFQMILNERWKQQLFKIQNSLILNMHFLWVSAEDRRNTEQ